jgi:hypothetical protein
VTELTGWLPDPVWPVLVLAVISFLDGLACIKPIAPIARCFTDVEFPRRLWWVFPVIKFAAAAGLVAGIWIPVLGLVTSIALVVYFLLAVGAHLRVRDLGRNLFVNATGMLVICVAVLVYSFLL